VKKDKREIIFIGHSGPVFGLSFSFDNKFLLSCSQDTSSKHYVLIFIVRLWSLQTKKLLVIYQGHVFPVWNVVFGPLGNYFASCSNDRTGKVWAIKHPSPLRILCGHLSDVEQVAFHPNGSYVVTGSSDKQIRMYHY